MNMNLKTLGLAGIVAASSVFGGCLSELNDIAPNVEWKTMFDDFSIKNLDDVVVGQPEFYKALSAAIDKFTLDQWKAYH